MPRRAWSRDELVLAFNLYCKIPFGRIHIRNPEIIALAGVLGRTSSAVSWKLANFARLDPELQKRNIAGALHGSKAEIEIWNEFADDWEGAAFKSEELLSQKSGQTPLTPDPLLDLPEGRTREAVVRVRVNQSFFRRAVLAAYGFRCCITGLPSTELLAASHIVPWAVDVKNRTNPRNGLCLNALHDRAFDCGLLTVTKDLKVRVSTKLKSGVDKGSQQLIWRFHNQYINRPRHFSPDPQFLEYTMTPYFWRRRPRSEPACEI